MVDHADYDILIAAGGDGTVNQVVNELVDQDAPRETCIAVLPLGTANDFATSLTIHDDNLVQAMKTAVHGTHQKICLSANLSDMPANCVDCQLTYLECQLLDCQPRPCQLLPDLLVSLPFTNLFLCFA